MVRHGTCKTFSGDLEDYKAQLLKNNDRNDLASDKETSKERQRREAAQRRARVAPLKKEIRALDEKMTKLSARKKALEEELVVQYSSASSIELALIADELSKAEDQWMSLNEQVENALAE
jgi:ATP-binding cassette subfamily F protein 3